jgi:excisionase family DNA binding protein
MPPATQKLTLSAIMVAMRTIKANRKNKTQLSEPTALWTVHQAASFLGYADGTIRNLLANGTLPRVKLPTGSTRIPSEAVRRFGYGPAGKHEVERGADQNHQPPPKRCAQSGGKLENNNLTKETGPRIRHEVKAPRENFDVSASR